MAAPAQRPPGYYQPGVPPGQAPGYWPMTPMPMPPPKKDNTAVIVVVVLVIVAAVAVLIPLMLYMMVSGLGPGSNPPPPTPTIVLQAGSWAASGGSAVLSLTVSAASGGGGVDPAQLSYIVSDSSGVPHYTGAEDLNQTNAGVSVNVDFSDQIDLGHVSPGDRIQVSVFPVSNNPLHGGRIQVFFNNQVIGTATLP